MTFWLAITLAFIAGAVFGYGINAIFLMLRNPRDEYP